MKENPVKIVNTKIVNEVGIRVDDHNFSAIKNVLAESSTFASSACSFGNSDLVASLATGAWREGFVLKIHVKKDM
jgi:hypothetical protein